MGLLGYQTIGLIALIRSVIGTGLKYYSSLSHFAWSTYSRLCCSQSALLQVVSLKIPSGICQMINIYQTQPLFLTARLLPLFKGKSFLYNIDQSNSNFSNFENQEIVEDMLDPREQNHFDYRFIRSKAGPLYSFGDEGNAPLINKKFRTKEAPKQMAFEKKKFGGIRMCARCLRTKPDRCHHCSQCNKCVLKMDHHCPWVANCIGFRNYKYFLNMLFYASLSAIIIVVTAYPVFLAVLAHDGVEISIAYFVITAYILAIALGILLTGFLSFHLWLLSN